eukprot:2812174-Alexandrium_andersonii.AAC.1
MAVVQRRSAAHCTRPRGAGGGSAYVCQLRLLRQFSATPVREARTLGAGGGGGRASAIHSPNSGGYPRNHG